MKPDILKFSDINSTINEKAPKAKIPQVEVTPFTTPEQFEMLTDNSDAIIMIVFATGTSPERLNDVIKKRTSEGTPVFFVSKNPGDNHGILKITYGTQEKAKEAGAISLEKVNVNNLDLIISAIQVEFKKGKRGTELGEIIREKFSYKRDEPRPIAAWEDPAKIDEMEKLYRHTLKRENISAEEIEEIIKKWRGNK